MINIAFSGHAQTFDVPLKTSEGAWAPADAPTASWTLLKADLTPVSGVPVTTVEASAGETVLSVEVPAEGNSKSGDTESRFLRLDWRSGGKSRRTFFGYLVIDWAPLMTTTDEVRSLLGAHVSEVRDTEIDLWAAWLALRATLGGAEAMTRLRATDQRALQMNRAIACRAAIEVALWMKPRLAMKMSSETLSFQRFQNVDIDALVRDLGAMEQSLLYPDSEVSAPAAFFELSATRADAITGG